MNVKKVGVCVRRPFARWNQTKFFRVAQSWRCAASSCASRCWLGLLALEFVTNPNPVPAVITIAGLVLLCFFFAYVFVAPDDFSLSATDRTLGIASKIFAYTLSRSGARGDVGRCAS